MQKQQPTIFYHLQTYLSLPPILWMTIFFVIPSAAVFFISFCISDPYGGIGAQWSWQTWQTIFATNYLPIMTRTLVLSLLTTLISIVLAVPTAYTIAKSPAAYKRWLLLLVILPFWINFLVRIFAWKVLLHPEGYIKKILLLTGLIDSSSILLYGPGAVLLVMVYSYLPFAILPIYAAAEKFDFALLEAAADLGASPTKAFWRIFLPGIKQGIYSAMTMVLIPALGAYVIPDMVGGSGSEMISSKIAQKAFVDRNLPQASALSAMLTLAVLIPFALNYTFKALKTQSLR